MRTASEPGNANRPGGRVPKALVAASLVAVVAGAIAILGYSIFRPSREDRPRALQKVRFKCTNPQCRKEFEMESREYVRRSAKGGRNAGRADCPECRQKLAGVPMEMCPMCRQYYLPEQARKEVVEGGEKVVEWTCPRCGKLIGKETVRQPPK